MWTTATSVGSESEFRSFGRTNEMGQEDGREKKRKREVEDATSSRDIFSFSNAITFLMKQGCDVQSWILIRVCSSLARKYTRKCTCEISEIFSFTRNNRAVSSITVKRY